MKKQKLGPGSLRNRLSANPDANFSIFLVCYLSGLDLITMPFRRVLSFIFFSFLFLFSPSFGPLEIVENFEFHILHFNSMIEALHYKLLILLF